MLRVDVTLDDGADCYDTLTGGQTPSPVEYLGYSSDTWFRASSEGFLLTAQGAVVRDGDALSWSNETPYVVTEPDGTERNATFHIVGAGQLGETQADPMRGLWPPDTYACGWPTNDLPPWEGDFAVLSDEVFPDGVFRDVCNEPVQLHDLLGSWLVIDVSAMDCGPCQSMARDTPAGLEALATEGFDVRTVTLLAPALSDPFATPAREDLAAWTDAFALEDPVLADRGFGAWVLMTSYDAVHDDDAGYPTWYVIDPDGKVVTSNSGYGRWEDIAAVIRAAAGAR